MHIEVILFILSFLTFRGIKRCMLILNELKVIF